MFGLEKLTTDLNNAVVQGGAGADSSSLAQAIYVELAKWLASNIYPALMTVLIFVVVLFIFYGAFLYFTAYGDEARATQAKKTITYAIVGLIIALLSFAIVSFVKGILVKPEQTPSVNIPSGVGEKNPLEEAPGYEP